MSLKLTTDTELTTIANAIREKISTNTDLIYPDGFVSAINGIETGTDVYDTTATASDVLSGKYFYTSAGVKTQGSITSKTAQTYIPTTTNQTIAANQYLSGVQTISGDANLVAGNIKKDVSIFGVTGSYEGSGGGAVSSNDVNFYDYDGAIVYSYSASDFANLTAMPANPSHEGLTAQGWNWTLANAKTYVASYGKLNIGQMYITTDGKTHIHIHLEQGRTSPMLGVCPNGTVDVDWGDGTAHDTLTGTSTSTVKWTSNHNYATPGDYIIKLTVSSGGSMMLYGSSTGDQYNSGLLRYSSSTDTRNRVYQNAIQDLFIGLGVTSIDNYAFYYCCCLSSITIPNSITSINDNTFNHCNVLSSITIPNSVTSIGSRAFNNCYNLSSVTIPNSITSIGSNAFTACYSLSSITIPNSVTSIDNSTFYYCCNLSSVTIPNSITSINDSTFCYCYNLSSVTIPNSITSIGSNAFDVCYGLAEIHFLRTSPPNVGNFYALNSLPPDCKIYVPTGTLSAYTSATNYPSSSTYTYIEE